MARHDWSDKTFDWDSLYKAESLGNKIFRFFRIGVHSKEKFGSLRWSFYLFNGSMHSITHPGYVYSQYPKWLWSFDCKYKPLRFLKPIITPLQCLVIRLTFSYLCYKFPTVIDEIISDAPRNLLSKKLRIRAGKMWQGTCQNKDCQHQFTLDNENCPKCGTKYPY